MRKRRRMDQIRQALPTRTNEACSDDNCGLCPARMRCVCVCVRARARAREFSACVCSVKVKLPWLVQHVV